MVVDMPFKTYSTKSLALKNPKKILKETKCDAVKLEGGKRVIEQIKFLIKNKIPVMGHLGLLPQSTKGKFKSKGKTTFHACSCSCHRVLDRLHQRRVAEIRAREVRGLKDCPI